MFQVEPRGDHVSLLRMDDGKVNAIGPDFLDRFDEAWREATREEKAVVIAGNAKTFSAGLNLKVLPSLGRDELVRFAGGFMAMFGALAAYERPVVAAVDGPGLAGGAIIALCADFRLVSPRGRLGLTEVPVGIPFPRPVADLARLRLPTTEWGPALLRGVVRDGDGCVIHGWAHELHPSDRVVEASVALAAEVADHSPIAFASAKRALADGLPARLSAFAKDGATAWVDLLTSNETMAALIRGFERATGRKP